ncbi:MAG: hypothetical protein ACPGVO_04905 [Spirulinaceae cyanobacterium]
MTINPSPWPARIVLAECQVGLVEPLMTTLEHAGWPITGPCSTTSQLLEILTQKSVDLLLLGNLAESNCFELFRKCRDRWQDLPIILLSHQPVSQYFRDWALRRGAYDVVQGNAQSCTHLQTTIEQILPYSPETIAAHAKSVLPDSSESTPLKSARAQPEKLTCSIVCEALAELTCVSINYFGSLAIGNYWRKAHKRIVVEHPWLGEWQVDHFGQVTIPGSLQDSVVDPAQLQSIQAWILCFEQECQRIIVDFPTLLRKEDISEGLKRVLP